MNLTDVCSKYLRPHVCTITVFLSRSLPSTATSRAASPGATCAPTSNAPSSSPTATVASANPAAAHCVASKPRGRVGACWISRRCCSERLLGYFDGSERTHLRIAPADIGEKAVGHFAFFRSEHQQRLWPIALVWLQNGQLAADTLGISPNLRFNTPPRSRPLGR